MQLINPLFHYTSSLCTVNRSLKKSLVQSISPIGPKQSLTKPRFSIFRSSVFFVVVLTIRMFRIFWFFGRICSFSVFAARPELIRMFRIFYGLNMRRIGITRFVRDEFGCNPENSLKNLFPWKSKDNPKGLQGACVKIGDLQISRALELLENRRTCENHPPPRKWGQSSCRAKILMKFWFCTREICRNTFLATNFGPFRAIFPEESGQAKFHQTSFTGNSPRDCTKNIPAEVLLTLFWR